ncbi:MAG: hypothetical protein LBT30_04920 [Clostridiales bacterium]|jgi:hypothetical protein|nr:hypothetical protein [Clostridiales bacterium]
MSSKDIVSAIKAAGDYEVGEIYNWGGVKIEFTRIRDSSYGRSYTFSFDGSFISLRSDDLSAFSRSLVSIPDILERCKTDYVILGHSLVVLQDFYKLYMYNAKDFFEFLEEKYNLVRSTATKLIAVSRAFLASEGSDYKPELLTDYQKYSYSQLEALLPLTSDERKKANCNMSVRRIKELHQSQIECTRKEVIKLSGDIESKKFSFPDIKKTERKWLDTRLKAMANIELGDVVVDSFGCFFEILDIQTRASSFTIYFVSCSDGSKHSGHYTCNRYSTEDYLEITALPAPYPECAEPINNTATVGYNILADVRESKNDNPESNSFVSDDAALKYEFMGTSAPCIAKVNDVEMIAQQHIKFRNDDERFKFLQNYKIWQVYAEIPSFGLKYYRAGLSNGEYLLFEEIGGSCKVQDAFRIISDKKKFGVYGHPIGFVSDYLRLNKLSVII